MKKLATMASVTALCVATIAACRKDDNNAQSQGPTPYQLKIPAGLPDMQIPVDNPMTVEGVALGRKLFYDPILSGNNTIACASCHRQSYSFTDSTLAFSIGIDHLPGTRNAMPLVNLGYQKKFFWDGGAADLESQVIGPIMNPLEMHESLENAIAELNNSAEYPALFKKAFGTSVITTPLLMKAIAQFERTMLSGNSKYDKYKRGEATFTAQEISGMNLFVDMNKGDCNHCHVLGSTFSDFEFRNTGLDSIPVDKGRALITLNPADEGKFKTPSLRNIALTAPYMHDGRFQTLDQCLDHYNTNFHYSANLDPNLVTAQKGRLTAQDKADVIAFLHTLTDEEFVNNPNFKKP